MSTDQTHPSAFDALGYSKAWIDLGILGESDLSHRHLHAGSEHPEHLRYRDLMSWLSKKQTLSDDETQRLLDLLARDPDNTMATSVLISLVERQNLSLSQLRLVAQKEAQFASPLAKKVAEARIRASVRVDGITDELFQQAVELELKEVQLEMIRSGQLSSDQLEQLGTRGATRAVQNTARAAKRVQ